ncbi:hypothetical protein QE367_000814 [Microbacterium paludicola]|uniref:Uncharacterized protein n=1 Tax=Microbacterium paludicola TaxID=300019 RepID=A0ABU1HY99_9MICO|nr:hypothetical protein [Microbacterium paludicola]
MPSIDSSMTGVGAADEQQHLVARQGDVHGVGAVAVDDGGDLTGGTQTAGEALAEVGARLCNDLGVGLRGHAFLLVGPRPGSAVCGFDANASAWRGNVLHTPSSITDPGSRTAGTRHPSPKYTPTLPALGRVVETSSTPGGKMDYGWFSHVLLWVIGAMTLGSIVSVSLALFAMGRQGYRKG